MKEQLIKLQEKEAQAGGKIAILTLNHPETFNSMSMSMAEQFAYSVDRIKQDDSFRAVLLTGEGKSFSSGGNFDMLSSFVHNPPLENEKLMEKFYSSFLSITELSIPSIAAINGHAIGAAASLALAADIRLISENAKIGFNFSRIGIHPGMGASYLVADRLGQQNAMYLIFSGKIIKAPTAMQMGFALEMLPAEQVLERGLEIAEEICETGPIANRLFKQAFARGQNQNLVNAMAQEAQSQAMTYGTEDFQRMIQAIRNKEQGIQFKGK